jgi:hypothetical protein
MTLRFPQMRQEVREALELLADEATQREHWLVPRYPRRCPDFDWVVRALYDTPALPSPGLVVGAFLHDEDEGPLLALGAVLGPLIEELDDVPDADYLAHPSWPEVVRLAGLAAAVMRTRDDAEALRDDAVGAGPYADPHG